jgi:hypothetical protein
VRGGQLSYRRRRRLLRLAALCALAVGVTAAIVLLPRGEKLVRKPTSPPSAEETRPSTPPRQTHLSRAEKQRLVSTVSLFISSSVARHHPERSWAIVHPLLREGLTKREWSTGNIPVVPYPAVGVALIKLNSVVGSTAQVEILLEPKSNAHLARKTFLIELRRLPKAPHRWAVSSWVPEGVSTSQMAMDTPTPPPAVVAKAFHAQHLSTLWIFAPVGLFIFALIGLPACLFMLDAHRFNRAKAEFLASIERD